MFQSTVNVLQGFGKPGQVLTEGPSRAEPLIANSYLALGGNNNGVGLAYTKNAATGQAIVGGCPSQGASVTGSIAGTVLTVTAVGSGALSVGMAISGASVTAGTVITKVLTQSGAAGGAGTYQVSVASTASSTTITGTGKFVFAGILIHSNRYKLSGTTAGGLAPQFYIFDNEDGEFMTMGDVCIALASVGSIGDQLQYEAASGKISAVAPGGSASNGNTLIPNSTLYRYPVTVSGDLSVARLTTPA
jgi:hypothetical protein